LHSGLTHVGRSSAHRRSFAREGQVMTIRRLLVMSVAVLILSSSAAYAGPCSRAIDRMQARVDAMIEAKAAAGPAGRESRGAMLHREPTPASIAAAEKKLGDGTRVERALAAIAHARAADRTGNKRACERALADARRAIGR
jgi:hypothetical protein